MKKKYCWIIILILFGLLPNRGLAQITIPEIEKYLDRIRLNRAMEGMRENTYKDVEGSPFMEKEFREGRIRLKDGRLYSGKLRYDMYAGEMQFIYYIKKNDLPAVKISNRKSLIGILEDKETVVLRFIKKEKISHNDPEYLKKLVEHYNSPEEMED